MIPVQDPDCPRQLVVMPDIVLIGECHELIRLGLGNQRQEISRGARFRPFDQLHLPCRSRGREGPHDLGARITRAIVRYHKSPIGMRLARNAVELSRDMLAPLIKRQSDQYPCQATLAIRLQFGPFAAISAISASRQPAAAAA